MTKKTLKNIILIWSVFCALLCVLYIRALFTIPEEITLIEGEEYVYFFKNPFTVKIKTDNSVLLKLNNDNISASGSKVSLFKPVTIKSEKNGMTKLNMSIMGLIPLKTVKVDVVSNKRVVPCGNTVGVKLKADGVLIIGISDVQTKDGQRLYPAKEAGLRPGDIITHVNNKKINTAQNLIDEIQNIGKKKLKISFKRNNVIFYTELIPVKAVDDNKYHIGLWVRDGTAGIGTLTFYDPETKAFGALGHGIADIDTGALMPVGNGEILQSKVVGIVKGKNGTPGELKGVFLEERGVIGQVDKNCEFGIYGILNNSTLATALNYPVQIAVRSQVKEGPAKILTNVEGEKIEEFSIIIQKVSRQSLNGSKGMIIKITDKKLLERTGGIVQGMSGSPIIQDGKLVGAVTHVLVNDPTRGYGIFIEGMIKQITGNRGNNLGVAS